MKVYILTQEHRNSDLINILGVYSHYNSAIDAANKERYVEFSHPVETVWVSGWSNDKEPTRYGVIEWTVQS